MSGRTAHIQIRVTPEFKARLEAFASERGRSLTEVLEEGAELLMTGEHRCDLAEGLAELLERHGAGLPSRESR